MFDLSMIWGAGYSALSRGVSDTSWCSNNYIAVSVVALRPPTVSVMSPAHVAQTHRMFHILH